MNFLAHSYLSYEDEELLLGNFLGDFLPNRLVMTFSKGVQRGIKLHRKIDSFTDEHPIVRRSTKHLRERHGKYAPVVLDILYDHILAIHFERFHPQELSKFSENVYESLLKFQDLMPANAVRVLQYMVKDNWLLNYRNKEGILRTLRGMDRRTRFPSNFVGAMKDIEHHGESLEQDFLAFFPEVMEMSRSFSMIND